MPTYCAMLNPNWPDTTDFVVLGKPCASPDAAADLCRSAMQFIFDNNPGLLRIREDKSLSWFPYSSSDTMETHPERAIAYVKTVFTEREKLEQLEKEQAAQIAEAEKQLALLTLRHLVTLCQLKAMQDTLNLDIWIRVPDFSTTTYLLP